MRHVMTVYEHSFICTSTYPYFQTHGAHPLRAGLPVAADLWENLWKRHVHADKCGERLLISNMATSSLISYFCNSNRALAIRSCYLDH